MKQPKTQITIKDEKCHLPQKLAAAFLVIVLVLIVPLAINSTAHNTALSDGSYNTPTVFQPNTSSAENELTIIANGEDGIAAQHEAGIVLAQLSERATIDDLNQALSLVSYVQHTEISESDIAFGYVDLRLAEGISVPDAINQLRQLPEIKDAQPNYIYHIADSWDSSRKDNASASAIQMSQLTTGNISDTPLETQSTLINDPYADLQWALSSVSAYEAWDTVKANKRVTVAVIDTGCDISHEDLKSNIVTIYDATGSNNIFDESSQGHGTHVCGIIAAEANNAIGVAGVSYNAQLLPIKVFVGSNASTATLKKAYQFLEDNAEYYNVRVVNLSIGLPVDNDEDLNDIDKDKAFYSAVQTLRDNHGVLTVCSAGNDADSKNGPYLNYPSDYLDIATSVIALKQWQGSVTIAEYSNYNMTGQKTKDIAAPGGYPYPNTGRIYSTTKDGGYGYLYGTSMASPCVAGIAALLFAANPDLTPIQVQDILHNSATDLGEPGWDETYGFGEVNAKDAVSEDYLGLFLDGDSSTLVGTSCTLTPSTGGDWTWFSSDSAIATVNQEGLVTGQKAGQAVISAHRASDNKTISRTVTVYDISYSGLHEVYAEESIDLIFNENPDTGMWIVDSADDSIMELKVDGTITVTGLKEGSTTITATLASNEKLKVIWDITVLPARIDLSAASIELSQTEWEYSGNEIKPATTVKLGSSELIAGRDYLLSYENNVNAGAATVIVTGINGYKGQATTTFTITISSQPMHRLYNPNSGEHFYTASDYERDYLVSAGWRSEGEGWTAPLVGADVYRVYNPNAGDHHYTTSAAERDMLVRVGWIFEEVGWKSASENGIPLYRQYNPNARAGSHNYTTNLAENDMLVSLGWKAEGIAWYGV